MARKPIVKLEKKASIRPELRDEPRPEMDSSKERAKKRAAEIRAHRSGDIETTDRFGIDPSIVPDGWTYEWKRKSIMNQEDPAYTIRLAEGGWEPVPASRHPGYMPKGNHATIERDGMVLMERPKELTDESRDVELRRARNQVRAKEEQLGSTPAGTLPRDSDSRTRPQVKKSYEAMPVPKE
jgi:hypothetical protein